MEEPNQAECTLLLQTPLPCALRMFTFTCTNDERVDRFAPDFDTWTACTAPTEWTAKRVTAPRVRPYGREATHPPSRRPVLDQEVPHSTRKRTDTEARVSHVRSSSRAFLKALTPPVAVVLPVFSGRLFTRGLPSGRFTKKSPTRYLRSCTPGGGCGRGSHEAFPHQARVCWKQCTPPTPGGR